MTDAKKKLIFVMLEWSRDTGRIIRYRYEGDEGESRLSVPDTTPDETNAQLVADVFQGDCTFEKGQLVVDPEALKHPPFIPLTPKDFEGSEWTARYGFSSFHSLRAQIADAEERARKSEEALNEVRAVLKGPTSMGDMLDAVQLRVMSAEDLAAARADAVREFAEWLDAHCFVRVAGEEQSIEGLDVLARYLSSRGVLSARPDDGRVERVLRRGLEEMAELDCAYGDRCPTFSRHGRCTGCKARAVLAAADGEVEP